MKKLFLFTIVSIGIISVVFSPNIWAIVEPHITITMDAGQTTNPIEIKDSDETTIFSIDPNGMIFPSQSNSNFLEETVNVSSYSVLTTDTKTNPHFVWMYDVEMKDSEWIATNYFQMANSTRITGTGTCYADLLYSFEGDPNWYNLDSNLQTSFNGWEVDVSSSTDGYRIFDRDVTTFGYGFYNSNGATTCEFEDVWAVFTFPIPAHWTLTKVI